MVPLCSRSYTHLYTHLRRLYTDVYTYQIGSLYQSQQCVYISRCTKILIPFGTTQADLVYAFSFKRCKMSIHIVSISNECVYTIHCSVTSWALILSTACAPRHPPHEMTPLCAIEPWLIWWWFLKEIYKNSANPTKRWGGDVAPSCARRCVGSRLPDHARCSFFVRSRHRAHVLPRRAIRLSAGDLGHAHQNSHICLWLRTTSAGWRSEGKSWTRPTSTEHPPCNVR